MPRRYVQIAIALVLIAVGGWLIASPLVVAEALGRPHATSSQMINLRATWGGAVVGIGAFVGWLPARASMIRGGLGLLMCVMAGVGLARLTGFVIDGHPDGLQWAWIIAETVIVAGCAIGLRTTSGARHEREARGDQRDKSSDDSARG